MVKKEQMVPLPKLYARTDELATAYGLTREYLRRLRHLKQGPQYRRLGKIIVYDLAVFEAWFLRESEVVKPDPRY